jgi:serine/threonine protein kinase
VQLTHHSLLYYRARAAVFVFNHSLALHHPSHHMLSISPILSVVYRDLKPDNVGFDVRGDVKIFDFGLSRQLPSEKLKDGTYNMTGDTGSPRYMAPEGT